MSAMTKAWSEYYRAGMGSKEARAFKAGYEAALKVQAAQEEVLKAAKEYVATSGPFLDTDGYMSYRVGDSRRLENAVKALEELA